MKRTFTMMSVVALLIAGCGSSGNNGTGGNGGGGGGGSGGTDMSAAAGSDMAASLPADMLPAYGCHALYACIGACAGNQGCIQTCAQSSTTQAVMLYGALRSCIRKECNPHPDGGPAPCSGGSTTPQCMMCQADVIKATGTCTGDPMYCGTCYTQYMTCEANTP